MLKQNVSVPMALLLALAATWGLLLALNGDRSHIVHAQGPDGYDTYYVTSSGDCGGMTPCYATIQAAVDAADDPGDVIKIAAGTYTGINDYGGLAQVVYVSKTVTIRGGYTAGNWITSNSKVNTTRLDAQEQGRVVYITGDISPTIEGLYITGGDATGLGGGAGWGDAGGGVYIITATATMSNNRVLNNTADCGGGMYLRSSDAIVKGNTVTGNFANHRGGGVHLRESSVIFNGNTVTANTASGAGIGGGIDLSISSASLIGNSIVSNTAYYGGGLQMDGRNYATLIGNTFTLNTATYGGGLFDLGLSITALSGNTFMSNTASLLGGGLLIHYSEVMLVNNVVANNQSYDHGSGLCIMGSSAHILHNTIAHNKGADDGISVTEGDVGTGPIPSSVAMTNTILVGHAVGISVSGGSTATVNGVLWHNTPITVFQAATATVMVQHQVEGDPAFVNAEAGDYHIGPGSRAIDAGVEVEVDDDMDGEPRPLGYGYDIGADELGGALNVSKQATPNVARPGAPLTYTLRVTNTGCLTLTATITDILSSHVTPTGVLTWTPIIPAPAGRWEETVVVTVTGDYSGPLTNVVRVSTVEGVTGIYTEISTVQTGQFVYLPFVLRNQ